MSYYLSLSPRDTSMDLGAFGDASHEAVSQWCEMSRHLFQTTHKKRWALAVGETNVKVQDGWVNVWAAIDIDS